MGQYITLAEGVRQAAKAMEAVWAYLEKKDFPPEPSRSSAHGCGFGAEIVRRAASGFSRFRTANPWARRGILDSPGRAGQLR
jgi:hypothetical protein